jgi:hypothetical protein
MRTGTQWANSQGPACEPGVEQVHHHHVAPLVPHPARSARWTVQGTRHMLPFTRELLPHVYGGTRLHPSPCAI